jgi:hypothetical protein
MIANYELQILVVKPGASATRDEASGLYYARVPGSIEARAFRFSGAGVSDITLAVQVLPAWMSVKQ